VSGAITYRGYAFPRALLYSDGHAWVRRVGERRVIVGVTNFAQRRLRAVVFVDLPRPGTTVRRGDVLATLESVETVDELRSPLSGTVVRCNEALEDDPSLVSRDPYGDGWVAEIEVSDLSELGGLLSAEEYVEKVVKRELEGG